MASVPVATLRHIAAADGFSGLGLARREASWAIKALYDSPLPLFAAADDRETKLRPEQIEEPVTLEPMKAGREVVEDYRTTGLSLRSHPVHFLRSELERRLIKPCASVTTAPNGQRITVAGLVLVRQMPGSAKGVMFITLEDETANANLIVWPTVFEKNRRTILSATMLACRGRLQRANGVIHVIADEVYDLTRLLRQVSGADDPLYLPAGRGDEARRGGSGPDNRDQKPLNKPRDMYVPDLHIDTIKMKARNFR